MVTIDNSAVAPGSTVAQIQAYIPPSTSGVIVQNTNVLEKLKVEQGDALTLSTLLSTANTWTATQTFPVASFSNLLSTANTWTATQSISAINLGIDGSGYYLLQVPSSSEYGDYEYNNVRLSGLGSPIITINSSAGSDSSYSLEISSYANGVIFYITAYTGNVWVNGSITTKGGILNDVSQTTITGTTAGSAVCSMPEQGSSYKKVIVYLDGYENDSTTAQTYTFPTAFSNTPAVSTNSASVPGVTVSTTKLSLAPDTTTAYTGWIIIEGY